MATLMGVSERTIKYRLQQFGMSLRASYSGIPDEELDVQVESILQHIPKAGLKTVQGYLTSRGIRVQRQRLRNSLQRCDPHRQELRRLTCIRRRRYRVPSPLALWHIDGNHKLIRWRIVVHGGVDGFTRAIVYLGASNNNRAETVLDYFKEAVTEWGLPSRVRADMGGENVLVKEFMLQHPSRGSHRGSFISGRSVHNCRIERLWRDVYEGVLSSFYALFYHMEDVGVLHVDNELHIFSLHCVFLPRLNALLKEFVNMWNNHPLRTEGNKTPVQLFIIGLHAVARQGSIIPTEYFQDIHNEALNNFGVDPDAPLPMGGDNIVDVPEMEGFLSEDELQQLLSAISTENHGHDLWEYDTYRQCCLHVQSIIDNRQY